MTEEDFNIRIDRVTRSVEVIRGIDSAELQAEAFRYLLSTTVSSVPANGGEVMDREPTDGPAGSDGGAVVENAGKPTRKRSATASKQSFTFDKSLDIYQVDGASKTDFNTLLEKHFAKTQMHRMVIAIYWLKKEVELAAVSIDHVYTIFKTMQWPVPANLANALQQAGSKGFLDSRKRSDLTITTHGENLVEHDLKPKV